MAGSGIIESLPAEAGTYALFLRATASVDIRVGRLGVLKIRPGVYVYVGSARGPGGLRARLSHHLRGPSSPRWHIDYLRAELPPLSVWYSVNEEQREHQWADLFGRLPHAVVPQKRFGASDCRCSTHLYFFPRPPKLTRFARQGRRRLANMDPIRAVGLTGNDRPKSGPQRSPARRR